MSPLRELELLLFMLKVKRRRLIESRKPLEQRHRERVARSLEPGAGIFRDPIQEILDEDLRAEFAAAAAPEIPESLPPSNDDFAEPRKPLLRVVKD